MAQRCIPDEATQAGLDGRPPPCRLRCDIVEGATPLTRHNRGVISEIDTAAEAVEG
jgi:hypothetical protein